MYSSYFIDSKETESFDEGFCFKYGESPWEGKLEEDDCEEVATDDKSKELVTSNKSKTQEMVSDIKVVFIRSSVQSLLFTALNKLMSHPHHQCTFCNRFIFVNPETCQYY